MCPSWCKAYVSSYITSAVFFSGPRNALQAQHSPLTTQPAVFSLVFLQTDQQFPQKCYVKVKIKTKSHGQCHVLLESTAEKARNPPVVFCAAWIIILLQYTQYFLHPPCSKDPFLTSLPCLVLSGRVPGTLLPPVSLGSSDSPVQLDHTAPVHQASALQKQGAKVSLVFFRPSKEF